MMVKMVQNNGEPRNLSLFYVGTVQMTNLVFTPLSNPSRVNKTVICIVFNGYKTKNHDFFTGMCSSYG